MNDAHGVPRIGFTCAYTPLAVIEAAGFAPYRVLPIGDAPDRAGQWLHDNLCPHVKRILDRAMAGDLPDLAGMVIINSCDAMRRLADAWQQVRPQDPVFMLDLPTTSDDAAISFFACGIESMAETLAQWNDNIFSHEALKESLSRYNTLVDHLEHARRVARSSGPGSSAGLQHLNNFAATEPFEASIDRAQRFIREAESSASPGDGVPIFLFGNLLPDPAAINLIEQSGARIVDDDLCTSARAFNPVPVEDDQDPFISMAAALLRKPPCARTFDPMQPLQLADLILERATACGARGVVGFTMKFCDPYLARLPMIEKRLKEAGMPLLLLEGDLSLGSIGQQRTRIEAFIEMLR